MFRFKFNALNLTQLTRGLGAGVSLALALSLTSPATQAAPTGGQVVSGNAAINQAGNVTNINQSSQKAIINWQQFNIGKHETVNFNQPNANASTLNRVTGITSSLIEGALNANGKVFLVNPNGIVFSKDATVNVGGLVASTRDINNQDFLDGNYVFSGNGQGGVLNAGLISAADKGMVALLGQEVINQGVIAVKLGRVELASGNKFTLNLNGNSLTNLTVDESTYNGLVSNQGIITAQGGQVFLTSRGLDQVLNNLTNNEGIIEANRWEEVDGQVVFSGDLINVDGEITATEIYAGSIKDGKTTVKSSAVLTGDFVETSGKKLHIEAGATIKAKHWLLDPLDVTIKNGGDTDINPNLETVDVTTIQNALNGGTNVTIEAKRHITVEDDISWTNGILGLHAGQTDNTGSIFVNAVMNGSGAAGLDLKYGANGTLVTKMAADENLFDPSSSVVGAPAAGFTGKINFTGSGGLKIQDDTYTRISNATDFKNLLNNSAGKYYLSTDLALGTGWAHRGNFSGVLEGLGHTVSLTSTSQGLFNQITTNGLVRNLGVSGTINGTGSTIGYFAGTLTGNAKLENVYASGTITGKEYVGGLVGKMEGSSSIIHSYKSGPVNASGNYAGGLVASMAGTSGVKNSYAWADVKANNYAGGFVSYMTDSAKIYGSKAAGNLVSTTNQAYTGNLEPRTAGFVSWVNGAGVVIDNSHTYITNVNGGRDIGGFVGWFQNGTISNSSTSANVTGGNNTNAFYIGGFVGYVSSGGQLIGNIARGNVRGYNLKVGGIAGQVEAGATFENNHYLPKALGDSSTPNVWGLRQVGGLIGYAGAGLVIKDSSARGWIFGTGDGSGARTGGLVGETAGAITFNNSWFGDFALENGKLKFTGTNPELLPSITSQVYSTSQYGIGGFIGYGNGNIVINGGYIAANTIYGLRSVGGFVGEVLGSGGITIDKGTNGKNSYIYIKTSIHGNNNSIGRVGGIAGITNNTLSFKNLDMDIGSIYSVGNHQDIGGLVGWKYTAQGDVEVENVHLTLRGDLKGGQYLGGFFGEVDGGSVSIKNSSVDLGNKAIDGVLVDENNIEGSTNYVGGLIGYLKGTGTLLIENTTVKAHSIKAAAGSSIGGLVGNNSSTGAGTITNAKVLLNPTAGFIGNSANNASNVGGLVGYAKAAHTVTGSEVVAGSIRGASYIGGLFGNIDNSLSVTSSKVTASGTNSGAYLGGIYGSSTYVGGFAGNVAGALTLSGANEVNANQIQGTYYIGGVAGLVSGVTDINGIKVTVANNILGTSHTGNNGSTGGVVGQANNTLTIKNAQVTAENIYNSNASARHVGGLVGYHNSTNQFVLSDVKVITSGAIGIKASHDIGGLIGLTKTTHAANSIKNAYVESRVEGTFIGGLIGRFENNNANTNTVINSVYYQGTLKANGYANGGLVGYAYSNPSFTVSNAWVGNYDFVLDGTTNSITSATKNSQNHSFDLTSATYWIGGMFGEVGALTVTNSGVNLKGSLNGTYAVGGVAGRVNGNFVADNVQVNIENDIYATSVYSTSSTYGYDSFIGGLVGWLQNGSATISNVEINARDFYGVNSATRSVGGLIGRQYGNYGFAIKDVEVNLNQIKGSNYLGSLIGRSQENTQATNSIKNAQVKLANGMVVGGNYAGGFISNIHNNSTLLIEDSLYEGSIIGANADYGGLVGNSGNLIVINTTVGEASNTNSIKGSNYLGGVVGTVHGALTLEKVTVNFDEILGTSYRVGGVAGYVTGAFKADETAVNINKIQGTYDVAGLVGRVNNTTHIGTNTSLTFGAKVNTAEIIATANASNGLGGLVGYANAVVFIKNSEVVATIQIRANSGNYVGGLIGFMSLNTGYSIDNTSVTTPLIYGGTGVGGLLGYANNTGGTRTISNSHANVDLIEGTGNYVGGLIGDSRGAVVININNSSFVGGIKGKAEIGGLIGTLYSVTNLTNVYAGNFTITTDATGAITDAVVNGSSNFTINSQNNSYVGGAIGYTSSALTANNVEINFDSISGYRWIGGFIGESRGAFTANNVNVKINGNITATESSETNVGGLIGKSSGGAIKITNTDVEFDNIFALNGRVAGGLIGWQSGNYIVELENINVNFNKIEAKNNGIGGLIAVDSSSNANNSIKNVIVNGDLSLTAAGAYVGGFVGLGRSYKVENSHFEGKLLGNINTSGGLFGQVVNLDVKNSSVKLTGNITGTYYLGGLAGYTTGTIFKVANSDFEFADILGTSTYVGGLVGYMSGNALIEIDTVNVSGGTVQGTYYVGGLIAYTNSRNANNKILNTDVELTAVKSTTLSTNYGTGGFVGHNYYTEQAYLVENSSFKGDVSGGEYVGGLFGYVGNINLKDTRVETSSIKANKNYAGGIAGWVNNIFTAENVKVIGGGNIEAATRTGGFAGYTAIFNATNVEVDLGSIKSVGTDTAGLIGYGSGLFTINGATIKVNEIISGATTAGGVVAYFTSTANNNTFNNILVEVALLQGQYPVGGIIAYQQGANGVVYITNSSFSGKLNQTGNHASHGAGGMVGTAEGMLHISDSFVGEFEADGTPKAQADLTTELISAGQNLGGLVGIFTKGSLVDNHVAIKTLQSTQSQVGGIVGKAASTNAKTMSGNQVSLAEIDGASNVGGLVGLAEGGLNISGEVLDGVNVEGTGNYVGGLVGQMLHSGTITNSTVKNSHIYGVDYVGGIVGSFTAGSMTSVFVLNHEDLHGRNYVGGVVGYTNKPITTSGSDAYINDGVNAAELGDFVGGFAGAVASGGVITNSYALGKVKGKNQVGGFVGQLNAGTLENVYAAEDVTANAQVGGLVGYALGNFTVKNSYSLGKIQGTDAATTRGLIGQGTKAAINSYYLYEGNEGLTEDTANLSKTAHDLRDGEFLQSMGWDIVLDETLPVKLYPQLRWTCAGSADFCDGATPQAGSTVWVIGFGKDLIEYKLSEESHVYNKQDHLNLLVTNGNFEILTSGGGDLSAVIAGWTYGDDYWFEDASGNKIASIINVADSQGGIRLFINHDDFMVDQRSTAGHEFGKVTITPAQVTVKANDYTKTYDGKEFNGGAGVVYLVAGRGGVEGLYGDDVLGGTLTYGGSSQGKVNVGTGEYDIAVSGLSSATGNYQLTYEAGKLFMLKAELHVRPDDAIKTYDGKAYDKGQEVAVYSGFVGNEDESVLGGSLTYTYTKAGDNSHPDFGKDCAEKGGCINAGLYDIELSGLTSDNYDLHFDHGELTIRKANLTIAADNEIFKYLTDDLSYVGFDVTKNGNNAVAGANGSYTYEVIGFVNGEDASVLDASGFYFDVVRGTDHFNSHITGNAADNPYYSGGYLIVPTGMQAENYAITVVPGHLIVSPNPVVLAAADVITSYNGTNHVSEFKATWYDAEHNVVDTFAGATSFVITITDTDSQEYNFKFGFDAASSATKDAGQYSLVLEHIADGGLTGLVQGNYGDTPATASIFTESNDGVLWALKNNSGDIIADVFFGNGGLVINKLVLDVEVNNENRTYTGANQSYVANGANKDITYSYEGKGELGDLIAGELAGLGDGAGLFSYTGNTTGGNPFNVGAYGVTLDAGYFTATGDFNPANYDIHLLGGTLVIGKADLEVDVNSLTKDYDASLFQGGNGVTYNTGLVGADVGKSLADLLGNNYADQILYNGNAQNAVNVGNYTLNASGLSHENYNFIFHSGNLDINPVVLTVTANNDSKVYDANAYTGGNGVVYSGFKGDDTAANALTGTASYKYNLGANLDVEAKDAGSYALEVGGLTANHGNYIIQYVDGTLTIEKAPLVIKADNHHVTYNGLTHANTAEHAGSIIYTGFVGGEDEGILGGALDFDYTGDDANVINAGVYSILPKGYTSNNYAISYETGVLEIDKVTVTVTANDKTGVYRGEEFSAGNGVTYDGFVNGEDATHALVDTSGLVYDLHGARNAGEHAITPSGVTATNYDFIYVDGKLTITKAVLTATANPDSKTYDTLQYNGGAGYTLAGFVGDDFANPAGVFVNEGSLVYSGSSAGKVNAGTYSIEINGLEADNYTFTYFPNTLVVNKAELTVTANDGAETYKGSAYTNGYGVVYSGFLGGDNKDNSFDLQNTLAYDLHGATNVGDHAITPSGLDSTNYNITFVDGALTITKAALTVTANNDAVTYKGAAYVYSDTNQTGVSYAGFLGNDDASNAFTDLNALAYDLNGATNAGDYAITPSGLTSDNYEITFVDGVLTINKAILTATANSETKTYDAMGYVGNKGYTLDETGLLGSDIGNLAGIGLVDSGLVYSGDAIGKKDANTYANGIVISGLYSSNYEFDYQPGTLIINQAEVVIKANDASKTYNGATYQADGTNFTTSFVGLQGGETANSLGLSAGMVYDGAAVGAVNAGSYFIEVSHADTTNYFFTADNTGVLTINKAVVTVTANSQTKEYDATNYAGGNGVQYSGFVSGEDETNAAGFAGLAYGGDSQNAKNVGEYAITPEGLSADNYDFVYVNGVLKINPAQLTITADSKSKKYDGNVYADGFSYSVDGLKGGETRAVLDETNKVYYIVKGDELYTDADAPANAGAYFIQVTGIENSNYDITFVDGLLAIGNNPLVITATDVAKVYDGEKYVFTVDFANPNGFDAVGWQVGDSWSELGKYQDNDTSTGNKLENFNMQFVIKDNGAVEVLDWTNAGEYQIHLEATNGIVMGDWNHDGTVFIPNANGDVMISGDYEIHFAPGALVIDKADLNIHVNNENFEYNGIDYTGQGNNSLTVDGWVNSEGFADLTGDLVFTYNGADFAKNAGSYTVNASGLDSNNYEIHWFDGNLVIGKKQLTVTVQNENKTYNAQAFNGGNIQVTGFVDGEGLANINQSNLLFTGDSQGAVNAGTYHIYAEGLEADNYSFTYNQDALLTVNKKALVVSVDNQSKVYDSQLVVDAPLSYSGFEGGDSAANLDAALLGFTFNGAAIAVNAGSYEVIADGLASNNYEISYVNGSLVISKADLTITADDQSKVYNKAVFNPADYTVTYSGFAGTENEAVLGGGLSFAGSSQTAVNAGEYVITPEGLTSGNYNIIYKNGELVINKAQVTITAKDDSKIYNGAGQASSTGVVYQVAGKGDAGLYAGDTLGGWSLQYDGNASAKNVGGYVISVNGASTNSNYEIVNTVDGHFTITPATLTITANNKTKVYDSAIYNQGYSVSYSGFVGSENASVLDGSLGFAGAALTATDAGNYAFTPVGYTSGNYLINFVDGNLAITPAKVTVTANNDTRVYNGLGQGSTAGVTYQVAGKAGTGLYAADTAGGWILTYGGNPAAKDAGTYVLGFDAASASDNPNYEFVSYKNGTFVVNKADLIVTADDKTKVYDKTIYSGGYSVSYNGFMNGEDASTSGLGGALGFGGNSQNAFNAGTYTITPKGLTSSNYNIIYQNGDLVITPAELKVTVASVETVYNGGTSFQQSGGATVTLMDGSATYDVIDTFIYQHHNKDVGEYVGVLTVIGVDNPNYVVASSTAGDVKITPAQLIVKVDDKKKTQDGRVYQDGFTVSYIGLQGSDTPSDLVGDLVFTGEALTAQFAGSYGLSASGLTSSNYDIFFVDGVLAIDSRGELENLLAGITGGSATSMSTGDGAAADGSDGVSSFNGGLTKSSGRLTGMSDGADTITVNASDIAMALDLDDTSSIRVPLGRNSKIDLLDGGIRLPQHLNQEYYLELEKGADPYEAIREILASRQR